MTTLTDTTGNTVTFSDDLVWTDENEWHPIVQTAQRTITQALIISVSPLIGGRPITLAPDDSDTWLTRAQVDALRNMAAAPGMTYTLTLRGQNHSVIFRHHDTSGAVVEAKPVIAFNNPVDGDFYLVTLRFMEL